jgi:hypothetical protein
MALDDEILSERRRQWSQFTRLMTIVVIAAAIILLGMRLFLV